MTMPAPQLSDTGTVDCPSWARTRTLLIQSQCSPTNGSRHTPDAIAPQGATDCAETPANSTESPERHTESPTHGFFVAGRLFAKRADTAGQVS